jgi:hypothetical protein
VVVRPGVVALAWCLAAGWACRTAEPIESVRAREQKAFLETQIAGLESLVAQAERGELSPANQIAIGIEEKVIQELFGAALPTEKVVAGQLRVRVDSAQPFFRGGQAAVVFRARVSLEDVPSAFATLELGGSVGDFRLEKGRLSTRTKLIHFAIVDSFGGASVAPMLATIIQRNLPAIEAAIPTLEIPVRLEEVVRVEGRRMGPVAVKPGELPLHMAIAQVLPIRERIWILIDVAVEPWKPLPGASPS